MYKEFFTFICNRKYNKLDLKKYGNIEKRKNKKVYKTILTK
jgi:hypothetical protein